MIMNESLNELLEKSLERVNFWLQFAEAKHAALIAFILAVLAIIYGGDFIDNFIFETITATFYLAALVISMVSFSPRYDKDVSRKIGNYSNNDNLLYWKDIAKYADEDFLKRIYKDFLSEDKNSFKVSERLYAQEIIINARIADKKYNLFQLSVKIAIVATVLIPIFLIIVA